MPCKWSSCGAVCSAAHASAAYLCSIIEQLERTKQLTEEEAKRLRGQLVHVDEEVARMSKR